MKQHRLSLIALLLGGFAAPFAQASSDDGCYPDWSLIHHQLDACSNLPFLSPGNDSQVNLRLLLTDAGQASLPEYPVSEYDRTLGYGPVPFNLAMLHEPSPPVEAAASASTTPEPADDLLQRIGGDVASLSLGGEDSYAEGEGGRGRSNNHDTARLFLTRLLEADLPDAERQELARVRLRMLQLHLEDGSEDALTPTGIETPLGQQFAHYLTGATAFYTGDFDTARQDFEALVDSEDDWLRETARYMVGRTQLNAAQRNAFDEWGYPQMENVDHDALQTAQTAFEAYLAAYPEGRYALSANGLRRRLYWLMQDPRKLADEYARLFAEANAQQNPDQQVALLQEVDNKLLTVTAPDAVDSPLLLATLDLMKLRTDAPGALDRDALQAQRGSFEQHPALHAYLLSAYHFFVEGSPEKTLESLPSTLPTTPLDYLTFSQQTLRGLALEAKGDRQQAAKLWLDLLPLAQHPLQRAQLELALAMNYERSGQLDAVFADGSPIRTPRVREILLRHVAGPDLLRKQAQAGGVPNEERETALFALLYKDLLRGHYDDFSADLALLPKTTPEQPAANVDSLRNLALFRWSGGDTSGYQCPSLAETAQALQANAQAPKGLNCLGEFILRNGLDGFALDRQPDEQVLGGSEPLFPGPIYSRLDGYLHVVADAKASSDDKAYALYRAINCYAPSGYNGCGPQDIPQSQRKQWFQTLKNRYAQTTWAQSLKYYW